MNQAKQSVWINRFCFCGVSFIVLALYAWTCARTVTMEDSGEFLLSAFKLGVPHPPGYPLFVLLGHAFTYLPFGSVAYRVHLMSAVASSLSCGLLYLITLRLTKHQLASILAALLLGFSKTFWSQSVIAEVYALNAVLFLAILWIGCKLQDEFKPILFYLSGFLFGLALSNSWPLIILESGAFAVLLWPLRQHLLKHIVPFLGALLVGVLPYGFLVYRSLNGGDIYFINPLRDFEELWAYVARSTYANENVQPTWTVLESFKFVLYFFKMWATEFGYFALPLLALGLVGAWHKLSKLFVLATALAFLSSPFFLLFAWRSEFNDLSSIVYSVFHMIPFAMSCIWMACGLVWLNEKPRFTRIAWGYACLVALTALVFNYRENNLRNDSFAQDYATHVLESLPPNAVLIVWGDADTGPYAYTSLVEKVRPDVTVTSQMGVIFPERIFDRELHRTDQSRAAQVNSYVRHKLEQGRRVFATRRLVHPDTAKNFPFLYLNRGPVEEIVTSQQAAPFDPEMIKWAQRFMDHMLDGSYKQNWTYHRNIILRRLCLMLAFAKVDHPFTHASSDCKMGMVQRAAEVDRNYQLSTKLLREILNEMPYMPLQDKAETERLLLAHSINLVNQSTQNTAERLAGYQHAVDEVYPFTREFRQCSNSAASAILEIRAQVRINLDLQEMTRTYGRCPQQKQILEKILKQP